MSRSVLMALSLQLLTFQSSGTAHAEPAESEGRPGHHCLERQRPTLLLNQLFGVQYNPNGLENTFRLGICAPLIERPGALFDRTSFEVGIWHVLSPIYNHIGGYAQLTPLSLLQLRVEVGQVSIWPISTDRGGHYSLAGYEADFRDQFVPGGQGASATGWNVNLIAILRARVRLGAIGLVVMDQTNFELWSVGDGGHYLNTRRDVILDHTDWVIYNEALLCVEVPFTENLSMRVGLFDSLKYVPGSRYLGNLFGGMVMLSWRRLPRGVFDLTPFVRVGGYTHHAFRAGTTAIVAGLIATYELLRL